MTAGAISGEKREIENRFSEQQWQRANHPTRCSVFHFYKLQLTVPTADVLLRGTKSSWKTVEVFEHFRKRVPMQWEFPKSLDYITAGLLASIRPYPHYYCY